MMLMLQDSLLLKHLINLLMIILNLKKKKNLEKEKSHTLHFGEFIFKDEIVDDV